MPRPPRIEFPGAFYHVTSRGNAREDVFRGDDDRELFLAILADTVKRWGWVCHAYCLMGNHYHLLIETPIPNLSRGMQNLNGVYTQRFNRLHNRVGHVFQGRYKAIVVDREAHALGLARYIVMNPVKAAMVEKPGDYPWSSYRSMTGRVRKPGFLTIDWLLEQFGPDVQKARRAYKRFVTGKADAEFFKKLRGGFILGSDEFVEQMAPHLEQTTVFGKGSGMAGKLSRPALDELLATASNKSERNRLMLEAYEDHGYTLEQISEVVGLHSASVSRILGQERQKG